MRRRGGRGEEAAGVRGGVVQLLPVLVAGGAGPEAGHKPAQQQGRGRGVPGTHQPKGPEAWDDGVRHRICDGLRVPGAVHGQCHRDQARNALLWQQIHRPRRHRPRRSRFFRAFGLYFHCHLRFSSLANN